MSDTERLDWILGQIDTMGDSREGTFVRRGDLRTLAAYVRAMRADMRRLDWLEANALYDQPTNPHLRSLFQDVPSSQSLREAIDAAAAARAVEE